MAEDEFAPDIDVGELSFEEMMSLSEKEIKKLLREYDIFKKERMAMLKESLIHLPAVPVIALDLIQFLRVNNAINDVGIFRINGDATAVEVITASFTQANDIQDVLLSTEQGNRLRSFDVATALKGYFRRLKEPLVPNKNYIKMRDAMEEGNDEGVMKINEEMTRMVEPNKSILSYLMLFLQEIVANQEVNKMTANNLATCLTMSITRFLEATKERTPDPAAQLAAMLEIGLSAKIITKMLTEIDFTAFITPEKYFSLWKSSTYRPETIPESMEEFMNHRLFEPFKPRYLEAMRQKLGPPPVPMRATQPQGNGRPKKNPKVVAPVVDLDDVDV